MWKSRVVSKSRTHFVELVSKADPPPVLTHREAIVRRPSGELYQPPNVAEGSTFWFLLPKRAPTAGAYTVRWYGRTASLRRYEITRDTFVIDQPFDLTPEPPKGEP